MKNKRAEITITIFVIGILLICAITIGSFTLFKGNQKQDILAIGVEDINSIIEKFYFYKEIGKTNSQAIELINLSDEDFPRKIYLKGENILVIETSIPEKENPLLKIIYKKAI